MAQEAAGALQGDPSGPPISDKTENVRTYMGFTKRQWGMLSIFGLSNLFACATISVQAPFYPKEAELKGATASEYGFVFGIFQLTMFFISPICGILLGTIHPKIMLTMGLLTAAVATIAFGCLDFVLDHVTFITLSFILRIIQGVGVAAFGAAAFTSMALEFPNSVASAFAWFESFAGVGLLLGPTIGGVLFDLGGFPLPFIVIGSTILIFVTIVCFTLPRIILPASDPKKAGLSGGFGFLSLIKIPVVALSAFAIVGCSSGIGFVEATLEPHLRANFGLSAAATGGMFVIEGTTYGISAPLWGRFCDKSSQPKIILLIGSVLTFIGFVFIGPVIFMPFEPILWVTVIGLIFHGLGSGATLVSGFISAMKDAVSSGFEDSVVTYGLVSGMLMSAFSLGNFVGPSIGGILLDNFGFRWGSIYVLVTQVMTASLTIVYFCTKSKGIYLKKDSSQGTPEESEKLIPRSDPPDPNTNIQAKERSGKYGAV